MGRPPAGFQIGGKYASMRMSSPTGRIEKCGQVELPRVVAAKRRALTTATGATKRRACR